MEEKTEIKKIKILPVITCSLDDSITHIAKVMKEKKERRVFVVDKSKKLEGIITTTDLVYKALANDSKNLKAKDVMTQEVKSIDIQEDMEKALEIMNDLKTFTCPVTDKGKLLGLVSYHDLVSYVISSIHKK
jgi:CBS domain-containing protein